MSEPLQDEAEVIDGLPVVAEQPSALSVPSSTALELTVASPVQTAAAAVGGFVAGAAFVGLVHHRHSRRRAARPAGRRIGRRAEKRSGRAIGELVQVVASRSLLVDVHLLGSSPSNR